MGLSKLRYSLKIKDCHSHFHKKTQTTSQFRCDYNIKLINLKIGFMMEVISGIVKALEIIRSIIHFNWLVKIKE